MNMQMTKGQLFRTKAFYYFSSSLSISHSHANAAELWAEMQMKIPAPLMLLLSYLFPKTFNFGISDYSSATRPLADLQPQQTSTGAVCTNNKPSVWLLVCRIFNVSCVTFVPRGCVCLRD